MAKVKRRPTGAHHCAVKFKSGAKCLTRVEAPGELCKRHNKTPPQVITGRFSDIKRQSLRERIASFQRFDRDALDLLPEIELLRALTMEYIENYDAFMEAIIAWNQTLDPHQRPVAIPKIEDAAKLLESIGKLVARQNEVKNRSSISIEDFKRTLSAMGAAVAAFVHDPLALKQIELAWGNIAIDAKHPMTPRQRQLSAQAIEAEVVSELDNAS